MQAAVPVGQGGMAAIIGLADELVVKVCEEAAQGDVLAPANFNSPGQIVIAGTHAATERAIKFAKEQGAKMAIMLPVSVPSHCDLMRSAAEQLEIYMSDIKIDSPKLPVFHNVDVRSHTEPNDIRQALIQQLYSPVRWVDIIQAFQKLGVTTIIECGPGKILMGLTKRIDKNLENLTADAL
jgi:[acyl-carrier-protein] S-malonyltransferase